jgi:hypothetical protein
LSSLFNAEYAYGLSEAAGARALSDGDETEASALVDVIAPMAVPGNMALMVLPDAVLLDALLVLAAEEEVVVYVCEPSAEPDAGDTRSMLLEAE